MARQFVAVVDEKAARQSACTACRSNAPGAGANQPASLESLFERMKEAS